MVVLQHFGKRNGTSRGEHKCKELSSPRILQIGIDSVFSSRFSKLWMTGLLIPPRQQRFSWCLLSGHLLVPSLKVPQAYNSVFLSSRSLDFVVLQQYCLRWQNLTPVHRATRGINGLTSFKFTEEKDLSEDCMRSDDMSSFYTGMSHSNPVLSLEDWFLIKCGIVVEKWAGGVFTAGAREAAILPQWQALMSWLHWGLC